jgi:hypothetical protein
MIAFIIFYSGSCCDVVDSNCDIRHCRLPEVIIHVILLAVCVFLGSQLEESDQTKAQQHHP